MYDHGTTIVRGLRLIEALDTRRNEVWRAVADEGDTAGNVKAGVPLAVKLLNPAYEPVLPRRIGRRARSLSRLARYGTRWVPLLDHGYATDGRRYVVSPLHRSSLADQLEHGPMPWYPAAALIADAASTVAEAHDAGHSFGHLRPSGLLIDGPAEVRIAVYGMSTRRFDDGTAQYMAPEVTSEGRLIPPSDVFSLVLILASLVAGRPIDRSESSREIVDELSGSVPGRILEIIEYGLSTGLRNRYADADKLAQALESALRVRGKPVLHGLSTPPDDAVDPLSALLSEPLVPVPGDQSPGRPARGSVVPAIPDLRDPADPDETPTEMPFDLPVVEIDDPTDPGIAARRDLDTETDHFGGLPHLDTRHKPRSQAASGPLAELLAADSGSGRRRPPTQTGVRPPGRGVDKLIDRFGDDDTSPGPAVGAEPVRTAKARPTPAARAKQPILGSIIDITDHSNGSTGGGPNQPLDYNDHLVPMVEPSRMFLLADNVGHFLALHRRRVASSVAIIGITGAIGVALLIGLGDLLREEPTPTGGTPVSSSFIEQETTIERSSPLNDQAPLENARSLSYEDIPTTRPVRRTTALGAASTTAAESTVAIDESSTTTDSSPSSTAGTRPTTDTTSRKGRKTTTSSPPTTEATTTLERQTTTTAATTSTTKRKGPPKP